MARGVSEDELHAFRLRARADLLERMVSQIYGGLMGMPVGQTLKPVVRHALLQALEMHAASADETYLRHPDPELSGLDAADRVLFADEFLDVVSELKAFVEGLTNGSETKKT